MKAVQIGFTLRHSISYVVSWNDCNMEINLVLLKSFCVPVQTLGSLVGGKMNGDKREKTLRGKANINVY